MSGAILKITDGSTVNTIDLLSRRSGYILCDWRPARPAFEYITNKNWFTGVETPASITYKPIVDTFTFKVRDDTSDGIILFEQKLSRILNMAAIYWTNDRIVNSPFYIIAKSKDETHVRYAAVFSTQLHDSSNPYSAPFFSATPISQNLIVPITHGEWTDYAPNGEGLLMYKNVVSVFDSILTGKSQGIRYLNDDAKILLVNYLSEFGITHIFVGDSTVNKIDDNEYIPYDLFNPGDTSPYTVFGLQQENVYSPSSYHELSGIYFNITDPAFMGISTPVFQWEVYSSSGWTIIDVLDGTNALREPGTVLFHLSISTPLALAVINGITGFWARVKPDGLLTNIPEVSIQHPAVPALPYFDVMLDSDKHNPSVWDEPKINTDVPYFFMYTATEDAEGGAGNTPFVLTLNASAALGLEIGDTQQWFSKSGQTPTRKWKYDSGPEIALNIQSSGPYAANFYAYSGDSYDYLKDGRYYISSKWVVEAPVFKIAPDFSVNVYVGVAGVTSFAFNSARSYISLGSDSVDYIEWTFGDSLTTYQGASVNHTYEEPGLYTVTMTIVTVGGESVYIKKERSIVVEKSPVARFEVENRRGSAPLNPGFDGSPSYTEATLITDYFWEFGDGTTDTGVTPNKTYTTHGVYSVTLTVTDNLNNTDKVTYENYIYTDSELLYPGDSGINLELGFQIIKLPWTYDPTELYPSKLYIGARSLLEEMDGLLQGYLPIMDTGGNAGLGIEYIDIKNSSIGGLSSSYTGYTYNFDTAVMNPGEFDNYAIIRFSGNASRIYKGTYKIFLRFRTSVPHDSGSFFFSAGVGSNPLTGEDLSAQPLNRTRPVTDGVGGHVVTTLDLGSVTFSDVSGATQDLNIYYQSNLITSVKIYLYDIVMIPQDEWYAEISLRGDYHEDNHELVISSLTPNGEIKAIVYDEYGAPRYVPSIVPGTPLSLLGKDTRFITLSTLSGYSLGSTVEQFSYFTHYHEVSRVKKINRYFSSRGAR